MLSRAVYGTLHARQRIVRSAISVRPCLDLRPCFAASPDLCHQKRCLSHDRGINGDHAAADIESSHYFKQYFQLPKASHAISKLSGDHVGAEVALHGYLGPRVDLSSNTSFCTLVDSASKRSIQLFAHGNNDQAKRALFNLRAQSQHSPCSVGGVVKQKKRPAKKAKVEPQQTHEVQQTVRHEEIELELLDLHALNSFPSSINFADDTVFPPEQRHLQLRQSHDIRQALTFRSKVATTCRDYLTKTHGFVEIETPLLFKSTPEGAREFLVPTRRKGRAYALPQSPQQYKQILMASGIPKYFQIAKCFRDEDLRADRQPEFTQLDLEMSFAGGNDVMLIVEDIVKKLWGSVLSSTLPNEPFDRLSYQDAMSVYGSDKPDRRLGMEIMKVGHLIPADLITKIGPLVSPVVDAFKLSISEDVNETRKFVGNFMDSTEAAPFIANPDGQPGIFIYDPRKPLAGLQPFGFEAAEVMEEQLKLEEGDMIVLQARKDAPFTGGSTALGRLRLALHKAASAHDLIPKPTDWDFLWVNEFPLFSPTTSEDPGQGGAAGLSSTHHPFTAPAFVEDIDLLATDPLSVRADHYDLVLNGVELGGGSRRIHDPKLQRHILQNILKMSDERLKDFDHLLDVLATGCPPHAGIALGFDRLIATMLGKESIRDVIAFPKAGSGDDPLVKSPSVMTAEQLRTYHLKIDD